MGTGGDSGRGVTEVSRNPRGVPGFTLRTLHGGKTCRRVTVGRVTVGLPVPRYGPTDPDVVVVPEVTLSPYGPVWEREVNGCMGVWDVATTRRLLRPQTTRVLDSCPVTRPFLLPGLTSSSTWFWEPKKGESQVRHEVV